MPDISTNEPPQPVFPDVSDIPVSPIPPSNPTPPAQSPKPNTSLTILACIMAAIILIGLGAGGFFAYQNYFVAKPTATPETTFSTVPTSTPNPTANWKTYTSTKYGLQFKYPPSLRECCAISGPSSQKADNVVTLGDVPPNEPGSERPFDGVAVYVDANPLSSFQAYIDSEKKQFINLAKVYADKNTKDSCSESSFSMLLKQGVTLRDCSWDGIPVYYLPLDNNKVLVISYVKNPNGNFDQTFTQILSTFKFTESNQVTGIQTSACCSCPTNISSDLVGKNGWVVYEKGKDYSSLRPASCSTAQCAPCPL